MSFEKTYKYHTKVVESGYAYSSKDRGGETFRGISRVFNPNWPGWPMVDQVKASLALTGNTKDRPSTWKKIDLATNRDSQLEKLVDEFYLEDCYKPYEKAEIPERLRDKLFDTAVNVGHKNAVKFLQNSLICLGERLTPDGVLGPKTLASIPKVNLVKLLSRYTTKQLGYYENWLRGNGKAFWNSRENFYARAKWLPPVE
jgi:lysozyme family protein